MAEPALDQASIEDISAGDLLGHDGHRGLDEAGVRFVEDDQDVGDDVEVASGLCGVVETQDCGRGATTQDPAAGIEALGEGSESPCAALLGGCNGVDRQRGLGDHAEGAL